MNAPSVGAEGPVRETDVDVDCCWLGSNDMATVAAGATIATSERLREAGRRMHATKVAPPSPSLALVVPSANAKVKSTSSAKDLAMGHKQKKKLFYRRHSSSLEPEAVI